MVEMHKHRRIIGLVTAMVVLSVLSSCSADHKRTAKVGVSGEVGTGGWATSPTSTIPVVTSTTSTTSVPERATTSGGPSSVAPARISPTTTVLPATPKLGPGHGAYAAVFCTTASDCVAAGSGPSSSGVIGITTNAGKSWQAGTLPSGAPSLTSVACADTLHCVAWANPRCWSPAMVGQRGPTRRFPSRPVGSCPPWPVTLSATASLSGVHRTAAAQLVP